MNGEPIEVRFMPAVQRGVVVAATTLAGVFMLYLAISSPQGGSEIGWTLGGLLVWVALGFLCVPRIVASADAAGFEIVDLRLAALFLYPRCPGAWQDVTGVETLVRKARYGHFYVTRLHVRVADDPARVRLLEVSSRSPGYAAFVACLREHVDPAHVPAQGPGWTPARPPAAPSRAAQLVAALALTLALVLMAVALRIARH